MHIDRMAALLEQMSSMDTVFDGFLCLGLLFSSIKILQLLHKSIFVIIMPNMPFLSTRRTRNPIDIDRSDTFSPKTTTEEGF